MIVATSAGRLEGTVADGVAVFLGIPYGAPITNLTRWSAPSPAPAWGGVRRADHVGHRSPQMPTARPDDRLLFGEPSDEPVGESCLVLNVWTPEHPSGELPVLVYLHGGGFIQGSGAAPGYDGAALARRGDLVVITVNHRVGALGFLDVAGTFGDTEADSNVGMLDLVAALEWVRDNVSSFGGDPASVTLVGQSGGGWKASTLLAMPSARGLFHRVAIMSGAMVKSLSRTDSTALVAAVVDELGTADGAASLRDVDLAALTTAQMAASQRTGIGLGPVRDDVTIELDPIDALSTGSFPGPVMIGSTRHEQTRLLHLVGADPQSFCPDDAAVTSQLQLALGEAAATIVQQYRRLDREASPTGLYVSIATDMWMRIPAIRLAEARALAAVAPVFMYRFDWESPTLGGVLRATHGVDLPLFLANADRAQMTRPAVGTVLEPAMADALIAFARTGSPSHPDLADWGPYELGDRGTMIFDSTCAVMSDPAGDDRAIWAEVSTDRLGALSMPS